jgi:hypothetical protein
MEGEPIMQNQKSLASENGKEPGRERLFFLDWLRVLSIIVVFLIHCSKIFDYDTAVVFNTVRSPVLSAFRDFGLLWIMPLFFILSGAAVFLSQRSSSTGKFVKSRFLRLFIPLLIVGTFIVNSLYVYIERLFSGKASSGFFQWYPHYFDGLYGFGGNFAPLGQGTHLWYLEYLFVFSLILLPLFVRSRKRGTSCLSRLSIHFASPWALFFLFLPISVVAAAFEILGLGGARITGGWDPISYLLFFSYGYLIFSNDRIGKTIKKYSPIYLAVAIILTALFIDLHYGFIFKIPGLTRYDLQNDGALLPLNRSISVAIYALRGFLAWSWIIGFLGLCGRYLNFNNKFLAYANEAVLPFYILHHTIIYIVGKYVIQWRSDIVIKFVTISSTSFIIIIAIYEILIRRINFVRFLFGMKLKKSKSGR